MGELTTCRCPRCGYDQRGVVETWAESCPLRGCCTECGLDFAWWEVMRPEMRLPRWCIEYAERKGDLPWAAVKTFVASWWPWFFWSRLRMSHPVRWGRIRLLLALFLLAVLMSYVLEQATVATRVRMIVLGDLQESRQQMQWVLQAARTDPAYHLPPEQIVLLEEAIANCRVGQSWAAAVLEAVVKPWAHQSSGRIVFTSDYADPYPPPDSLIRVMWEQTAGASLPNAEELLVVPVLFTCAWVTLYVLVPCSFALLPVSRRRAKVRWRHIARVGAYSLMMPLFLLVLYGVGISIGWSLPWSVMSDVIEGVFITMTGAISLLPLLFLFLWWWAAISRHLRIPHALAVALLLTFMCSLAVFAMLWWSLLR